MFVARLVALRSVQHCKQKAFVSKCSAAKYVQLQAQARSYANVINAKELTSGKTLSTLMELERTVNLTDRCVARLKEICRDGGFLRLAVEGGGCSGFQYTFSLDREQTRDDRVIERDGVKVLVDDVSLSYLEGATLDYQTELIRSAFRVLQNPKAESGCSCGASFSLKID